MAKDKFSRYIWLVDTIYRADGITFEEINEKWLRNSMSDGLDLPLKTFHNHRNAIEEIFDISIVCDRRNGYRYYIENADDMKKGGVRTWLLNTFAVNNEAPHHHNRGDAGLPHPGDDLQELLATGQLHRRSRALFRQGIQAKMVHGCEEYGERRIENIRSRQGAGNEGDRQRRETDNGFAFPKDFDPEEYFYNSYGIIHDDNCPPEIVDLKVFGVQREYFRTLPLHHSQEETETGEDFSVFRYYLSPTYDFVQEILSHGCEVEVLSPEHLRNEIRKHAEVISERS